MSEKPDVMTVKQKGSGEDCAYTDQNSARCETGLGKTRLDSG